MRISGPIKSFFANLSSKSESIRFHGIVVAIGTLVVSFVDFSPLGKLIETRVELPLSFHTRENLNQSPILDPRIKILAMDDNSVLQLGNTEVSLLQWSKLISAITANNPRAIVVDKVFGHIFTETDRIADLKNSIDSAGNVSLGSFLSKTTIQRRTPLDLNNKQYNLEPMLEGIADAPEWLEISRGVVFGPDSRLGTGHRVGQINDFGDGYIAPIIRVGDDTVVPHLAISAFDNVRIKKSTIEVNGHIIPIDSRGLIPANFPSVTHLYSRTKALAPFVLKAEAGIPIASIGPEDIVLIMPLHYSGNFDVRSTPVGQISGGYYHAAVINSALTGKWLAPAGSWRFTGYFLFACLGVFLGVSLRHIFFAVSLSFSILGISALSLLLFSFADQIFPWFLTATSFSIAAISSFAHRARVEELKSVRLKSALKGLVSDT